MLSKNSYNGTYYVIGNYSKDFSFTDTCNSTTTISSCYCLHYRDEEIEAQRG